MSKRESEPSASRGGENARWWAAALGAVFVLALAVRVIVVLESRDEDYHRYLVLDAATYHRIATDAVPERAPRPYWQPPGYPWLLRGLYSIAGSESPLVPRIFQSFLGAFGCVILMSLTRRIGGARAGVIAGFVMALFGPLVYFDSEVLPASPATLLLLLVVWALTVRGEPNTRWARWRPVVAGLLIGVVGVFLPMAAPAGLFLLIWLFRTEGVRTALVFACCAAIPILPITVRNYSTEPDLVPISYNGGINFWIGNHYDYPQTVGIRPGLFWGHLIEKPRCLGGVRGAAEESAWYHSQARKYIVSHPLRWIGQEAWKAAATLSAIEIGRNRDIYAARSESRVMAVLLHPLGWPFVVLGPLAAVGIVALIRRRKIPWAPLLVVCGLLVAMILFFPTARYRAPILPLLIMLAAVGVPSARRIDWGAGILVLALSLLPTGIPKVDREETLYEIAIDLDGNGQYKAAEPFYRKALETRPNHADTLLALGRNLRRQGRGEEAREQLERAAAIEPMADLAWYELGLYWMVSRENEKARTCLEKAVEINPCNHRAQGQLAHALMNLGYLNAAEKVLDGARRIAHPRDRTLTRATERLEKLTGKTLPKP